MPSTKEITWNGVSSLTVPGLVLSEVLRDPLGELKTAIVEVPGREGAWVFPKKRGMKVFSVTGHIERETKEELRVAETALAAWLDVEGEANLAFADDPGLYYQASLTGATQRSSWRGVAQYDFEWTAQPYALDEDITVETWSSGVNTDHTWSAGVLMPIAPVVTITPTDGTLTAFSLNANGYSIEYTGLISSGNSVTINAIAPIVVSGINGDLSLTGAYNPALQVMLGVDGAFPLVIPTDPNSFHFIKSTGTATAITVTVLYRKKFYR